MKGAVSGRNTCSTIYTNPLINDTAGLKITLCCLQEWDRTERSLPWETTRNRRINARERIAKKSSKPRRDVTTSSRAAELLRSKNQCRFLLREGVTQSVFQTRKFSLRFVHPRLLRLSCGVSSARASQNFPRPEKPVRVPSRDKR